MIKFPTNISILNGRSWLLPTAVLCLSGAFNTETLRADDVPLWAYTQNNIAVDIDAQDGVSGVRVIETPDGNQHMFGAYTQGVPRAELSYQLTRNGDYTFTAVDVAQNRASAVKSVRNIDKEGPSIVLQGNPSEWTNQSVDLQYAVGDNISGVNYVILPDGTLHAPDNLFVNSSFQYDIDALYDAYGWDWSTPSGSNNDWTPTETSIALFRNREAFVDLVDDEHLNTALRATSTGDVWDVHNAWGVNWELTTGGVQQVLDYVDETVGTRNINVQVWLKASETTSVSLRETSGVGTTVDVGTEWGLYTLNIPEYKGHSIGVWQEQGEHFHHTPKEGLELYIAYPVVVPGDATPRHHVSGVYAVHQNGDYTFRAVDRAGNITSRTEKVRHIDKVTPAENGIEVKTDETVWVPKFDTGTWFSGALPARLSHRHVHLPAFDLTGQMTRPSLQPTNQRYTVSASTIQPFTRVDA